MRFPLLQQIDSLGRRLVPLALTLSLVILGAVPLHVPYLRAVGPALAVISVYYWSFHCPSLLPAAAVFAIGVVSDLFGGAPLGVGVLVFLLVHGTAVVQRRFFPEAAALMVWCGFVLAAVVAGTAGWLVASLLAGFLMDPLPALASGVVSIVGYPVLAYAFGRTRRSLLAQA